MRVFCLLSVLLLLGQCSNEKKEASAKSNSGSDKIVKVKYPDGQLRAVISYNKDKKKHGRAIEYYKGGGKYQEIDYKEGIKDGWARRYYENGKLAQETPYVKGKMNGIQKKYRDDGKLSTEATFVNDEPCQGLKEYLLDGQLKKKYPQIVITPIDEVTMKGIYTLRLSLTEKVKEVEFFQGQLESTKCIGPHASKIWNTDRYGIGEIKYPVLPGTFIMEKVNVIAKIKTALGNDYITQKSFNVAIENR